MAEADMAQTDNAEERPSDPGSTDEKLSKDAKQEGPAVNDDKADAIIDKIATIKIEGQEFELEASLAQENKTLKTVLQPHFSSVENANITREVKDGKLTVTIVKKAQHKGAAIISA